MKKIKLWSATLLVIAKPDVVCIYEYGVFESFFDDLQPLYLFAYKLG
jgi:hypothetical protein